MEIDIRVEGFAETLKAVESLPGLLSQRVIGDGLAAAARVIRDNAKALAPRRLGGLRAGIKARRRASDVYFGRKVPGGMSIVVAEAPHSHLLEFGTVERWTKTGAYRGALRPRPFLEPALYQNKAQQFAKLHQAMARSFNRNVKVLEGGGTKLARRLAATEVF